MGEGTDTDDITHPCSHAMCCRLMFGCRIHFCFRCNQISSFEADAEGVLTWIKTLEPYTSMLAMWTTAKDTVNAEIRDLTRRKRRYETNLFITPIALGHHYTLCSFANYGKQLMVEW
jgi:hypothetical protein